MYQTFIAPTETPPNSLAIKRALLTYDKVILSDPGDRDYFPPQLFMQAMSSGLGVPGLPIGMNCGPVCPLGKVNSYDETFDQLMNEIDYARREGIVDVVSTYDRSTDQGITIGSVPTGGYPLNSAFLLWAYRNIARDQAALSAAISDDPLISIEDAELLVSIGGEHAGADWKIQNDPALPLLDAELGRPELREALSRIARSRIASVMKTIGYCTSKDVVPTFWNRNYSTIASHMASRTSKVIDIVSDGDPHLILKNRVLELVHGEYVNDKILAQLSIDEVLRLRTNAWGEQAEARDDLLRSATSLSLECRTSAEFDTAVISRIEAYRKTWDAVTSERRQLGFSIKCDLLSQSAKAIGLGLAGEMAGTFAQLQSGVGAATILLAGCMYTADKLKEHKPIRDQIIAAEAEFRDNICFGIHNFYQRLS